MNITCRNVTSTNSQDLETVAALHMDLLSFGPMAELGSEFIRDVGYRLHLEDGLLDVVLCEVEGRAAGFVAFTVDSISFHRSSLREHWIEVSLAVLKSIAKDPRRLLGLKRAVWMVASRRQEQPHIGDHLGEVVSLAVKPEFLTRSFIRENGVWISEMLVRDAMDHLRQAGCAEMRMLVDEGNKAPLLVYHRMGARFETCRHGGEPNIQVWFDLTEPFTEKEGDDASA